MSAGLLVPRTCERACGPRADDEGAKRLSNHARSLVSLAHVLASPAFAEREVGSADLL